MKTKRRYGGEGLIIAMTEMTLLVDTLVRLWMERKGTLGDGYYTRGSLYLMKFIASFMNCTSRTNQHL